MADTNDSRQTGGGRLAPDDYERELTTDLKDTTPD